MLHSNTVFSAVHFSLKKHPTNVYRLSRIFTGFDLRFSFHVRFCLFPILLRLFLRRGHLVLICRLLSRQSKLCYVTCLSNFFTSYTILLIFLLMFLSLLRALYLRELEVVLTVSEIARPLKKTRTDTMIKSYNILAHSTLL